MDAKTFLMLKEKHSLSLYFTHSPACPREARLRVYARGGGVKGETLNRYFPPNEGRLRRGNSSEHWQSLFLGSERNP